MSRGVTAVDQADSDVLVVGAGLSGLMAAWQAQRCGAQVAITSLGGGASNWLMAVNVPLAQADVRDSPRVMYNDIIAQGEGINDPALVRDTTLGIIPLFHQLVDLGVEFARSETGFLQRHAAGSSHARSCYVAGMMWGPRARQVLRQRLKESGRVQFHSLRVVRLMVDQERAVGAVAVEKGAGRPVLLRARAVVLASGGIGQVYAHSTYPRDVWGSSYALAYRAGARLADMEFIQFEPLVACRPPEIRGYVCPTTLFGDGAFLRDARGKRFLLDVRPQGEAGIGKEELVLAMAEMERGGRSLPSGGVWLDARSVPRSVLRGYPWLQRYLRLHGIDLSRDLLEVKPAAHSCLGGIKVDVCRAATLAGLFAVGEAAAGVHGAGRLAGGSGTDVLVSGARGGEAAAAVRARLPDPTRLQRRLRREFAWGEVSGDGSRNRWDPIRKRCRELMSSRAGIWRHAEGLEAALEELSGLARELAPQRGALASLPPARPEHRVADMLLVAAAVVERALHRRESRGAHQRTDFPRPDPLAAGSHLVPVPGEAASSPYFEEICATLLGNRPPGACPRR